MADSDSNMVIRNTRPATEIVCSFVFETADEDMINFYKNMLYMYVQNNDAIVMYQFRETHTVELVYELRQEHIEMWSLTAEQLSDPHVALEYGEQETWIRADEPGSSQADPTADQSAPKGSDQGVRSE